MLCIFAGSITAIAQHSNTPGILFLGDSQGDSFGKKSLHILPIAIIERDSIYQPEADSNFRIHPRQLKYHRADSIYSYAQQGRVLGQLHVRSRDSQDTLALNISDVDDEQVVPPVVLPVDSIEALVGSSYYFRNLPHPARNVTKLERKQLTKLCSDIAKKQHLRLRRDVPPTFTVRNISRSKDETVFVSVNCRPINDTFTYPALFAIFRRSGKSFKLEYSEFERTTDSTIDNSSVDGIVDQFDLDGDGNDEVVTSEWGDEMAAISIFKRTGESWSRIYYYMYWYE